MNDITQSALEGVLTARAESLTVGSAPVDAVLAGARRRGARRRATVAAAGVLAVAGVGAEVAGLGGSGSVSAGAGVRRWVPVVTQQVGLAAGQRPMSGEQVIASGTVDGAPWQAVMTEKTDPAATDPMFAAALLNQKVVGAAKMTCVHVALWVAGALSGDGAGCGQEASPTVGEILPGFYVEGTKTQATFMAMVSGDVTKVVWSGKDGFRQEVVPLATPFPGVRLAVFPDRVQMLPGDDFAEYNSAGAVVSRFDVPARGVPLPDRLPS